MFGCELVDFARTKIQNIDCEHRTSHEPKPSRAQRYLLATNGVSVNRMWNCVRHTKTMRIFIPIAFNSAKCAFNLRMLFTPNRTHFD